jgi:hypothetical protein
LVTGLGKEEGRGATGDLKNMIIVIGRKKGFQSMKG